MDVKEVNNRLDNDFTDLFNNEEEMDIDEFEKSQESIGACIRLLESEKDLKKRLGVFEKLVKKFLPNISIGDVDEKLLQYLLPAVKGFLNNVFDELCQVATTINVDQKSSRTLSILQNYLQMCVGVHELLNFILGFILQCQEFQFCKIYNLPLNIVEILSVTFQHCKQSDKLYKIYFEDLKEIFSLFKGAQDVHIKLLKLLEKNVDYNVLSQNEIELLKKVLDMLSEIGSVLVDMNIKALADNWKGYLALTQKLSEQLNYNNDFDIVKPTQFLSKETIRNIKNVLKMNVKDQKGITQVLKICNFFTRIILKLWEIFWVNFEKICGSILDILSELYEYYPPFLEYKGCPEVIIKEINDLIFEVSNQILQKLIYEPDFYKELNTINVKATDTTRYLFFFTIISQNVSLSLIQGEQQLLKGCDISCLIDLLFRISKESYCEFFWKVQIPACVSARTVYNENVVNLTNIIVSLNLDEYNKMEYILLKNIMQDSIWTALLATDIWCLCLNQKSSLYRYKILLQILTETNQLLLNNFTVRPEKIFLENFLKRIYSHLSEECRCSLLEKFPLSSNLHIWKSLGLEDFPQSNFYIVKSILINITEKMESFKKGDCNADDFNFLCNRLEVISTLPSNDDANLKHLLLALINIWNFNNKQNEDLYKNPLFRYFIDKLLQATNNFILNFDNQQLLLVVLKLKHLLSCDFNSVKIRTGQILKSLSTKSFRPSPELDQITTTLSEIFVVLLQDKNPVVKQNILEIFVHFLNATSHDEIIQNAVRDNIELQNTISNFVQKNIDNKISKVSNAEEYFKKQKNCKFQHVCFIPNITNIKENNVYNKAKTEIVNEDEVSAIIRRVKNDLKLLHKVCDKENSCEENINEIVGILSKKIGYRF